jgi:low affinity Fe/Cu permease
MKVLCCLALLLTIVSSLEVKMSDEHLLKQFEELQAPAFDNEFISALEIQQVPAAAAAPAAGAAQTQADPSALATYLPDSGPFDNPATDAQLIKTIPETPSCTIRGQTIFEIRKMRADAKQIGMAIMYEIQIMEKRKAYIEQMTSYLNDRIRELNKVKTDLAAEQKWIQISNARISELAQKEKLIKLQDVMTCIRQQQQRLTGESTSKVSSLNALTAQANTINTSIKGIRAKIDSIVSATNT